MKKVKKQIVIGSICFTGIVIANSVQAIFSPYAFVRFLNIFVIILISGALGAFMREYYIQKNE